MPYDAVTGDVDSGSISADGSTYSNPKYMTTIVSGGAGNHEDESVYVKKSPSYTGIENYGEAAAAPHGRRRTPAPLRLPLARRTPTSRPPKSLQAGASGRRRMRRMRRGSGTRLWSTRAPPAGRTPSPSCRRAAATERIPPIAAQPNRFFSKPWIARIAGSEAEEGQIAPLSGRSGKGTS